jgi:hypothetical protein
MFTRCTSLCASFFQVKVNGQRVELGEVESVLGGCGVVTSNTVMLVDNKLVAYMLLKPNTQPVTLPLPAPTPATTTATTTATTVAPPFALAWEVEVALRAYMGLQLPAHLVPTSFVPLSVWPVNANGKLNRAALPALHSIHAPPSALSPSRALTPLERVVGVVWQSALQSAVCPCADDAFIGLGGDSLAALRCVKKLREENALVLPPHTVQADAYGSYAAADALAPAALLRSPSLAKYCALLIASGVTVRQEGGGEDVGAGGVQGSGKDERGDAPDPSLDSLEQQETARTGQALMQAAGAGSAALVRCLLRQCNASANPSNRRAFAYTALHAACAGGVD